jgi:hypothetical protein
MDTAEAVRAGQLAMDLVWASADEQWREAAENWVRGLPQGETLMAHDVVAAMSAAGHYTKNKKAAGPLIKKMRNAGVIRATGRVRPCPTSHGSMRTEWERT